MLTGAEQEEQARSVWWDDPIKSEADDRLDRGGFARHLADLLTRVSDTPSSSDTHSSTVVDLVGPWGSGKTSLVNLTEGHLGARWRVRRFNPWASGDVGSLLSGFFAAISGALPPGRRSRRARAWLLEQASIATPALRLVPVAGGALSGSAEAVLKRMQQRDEVTEERLRDLSNELASPRHPVLVVVDDVDRLLPDELVALLKAIRLLGRFPNIHYLLAYDEQTVLDVLGHTAVAKGDLRRAQAYLDKIVQVRLDVPVLQRAQADRLLNEGLARGFERLGVGLDRADHDRFAMAYQLVMRRTLTEPRVLQRYLAHVEALLAHVGVAEVDLVDFLIVTYVRLTYPLLHRRLAAEQGQLTKHPQWWEPEKTRKAEAEESARRWPDWLKQAGVPDSEKELVLDLLASLFPGLHLQPGRTGVLGPFRQAARRVGDPEYFERYFALGVPIDDIADTVVARGLEDIASGRAGPARAKLEAVLLPVAQPDSALQTRTLCKLIKVSSSTHPGEAVEVLQLLAGAYPRFSQVDASLVDTPTGMAETWAARLLERLDGLEDDERGQRDRQEACADRLLSSLTADAKPLLLAVRALKHRSGAGRAVGAASR